MAKDYNQVPDPLSPDWTTRRVEDGGRLSLAEKVGSAFTALALLGVATAAALSPGSFEGSPTPAGVATVSPAPHTGGEILMTTQPAPEPAPTATP